MSFLGNGRPRRASISVMWSKRRNSIFEPRSSTDSSQPGPPPRREVERKESGRFQSAAKFLKSLRGGGSHQGPNAAASEPHLDRTNPNYHSEGKGLRSKKHSWTSDRDLHTKDRSQSFNEKARLPGKEKDSRSRRDEERTTWARQHHEESCPQARRQDDDDGGCIMDGESPEATDKECIYANASMFSARVAAAPDDDVDSSATSPPSNETSNQNLTVKNLKDRDRRSFRKLTKDSGYETNYAESDYANIDLFLESSRDPDSIDSVLDSEAPVSPLCVSPEADVTVTDTAEEPPCTVAQQDPAAQLSSKCSSEAVLANAGSSPECAIDDRDVKSVRAEVRRQLSDDNSSYVHPGEPTSAKSVPSQQTDVPLLVSPAALDQEMVTKSKGASAYNYPQYKATVQHSTGSSARSYWDGSADTDDYISSIRSSSYQLLQKQHGDGGQHSRQNSNHSRQSSTHSNPDDLYPVAAINPEVVLKQKGSYHYPYDRLSPNSEETDMGWNSELSQEYSKSYYRERHIRKQSPEPPPPPVRDASSLKYIKYGPGHEKFPSWPVPASASSQVEGGAPASQKNPSPGSHRSKSWTEHTDYPKEKIVAYSRPHHKRINPAFSKQLKTVIENGEKIGPETFESRVMLDEGYGRLEPEGYSDRRYPAAFYPPYDKDGRVIGDKDYSVPSPPERDLSLDPLAQQDDPHELEEYSKRFREFQYNYYDNPPPEKWAEKNVHNLYTSGYSGKALLSGTPFLDQLRRESEGNQFWGADDHDQNSERSAVHSGRESVVTNSSSNSSNETLKWHGSMSDLSVASGQTSRSDPNYRVELGVVHSSRVLQPQRHNSECVLYYGEDGKREKRSHRHSRSYSNSSKARWNHQGERISRNKAPNLSTSRSLNQIDEQQNEESGRSEKPSSPKSPTIDYSKPPSVAERISQIERQSQSVPNLNNEMLWKNNEAKSRKPLDGKNELPEDVCPERFQNLLNSVTECNATEGPVDPSSFTYLDPDKKLRVSDPTLKAIQKQALLSYYERQTGKSINTNSSYPAANTSSPTSPREGSPESKMPYDSSQPQKRQAQSLPRDYYQELKQQQQILDKLEKSQLRQTKSTARLDKVPENTKLEVDVTSAGPLSVVPLSQAVPVPLLVTATPLSPRKEDASPTRSPKSAPLEVGRKESFSEVKLPATKEEREDSEPSESSRSGQLSDVTPTNETEMGHPTSREEPAPIPPKRPPKKPHLRARAGITTSPPPTGPRNVSPSQEFSFKKIEDSAKELKNLSPLRVSAQPQISNSSAISFAGRKPRAPDPPQQSPPNPSPVEPKTSRASTPDLPPPPPPPLDDKEIANTDEPLPPPPSPSQVKGFFENGFSSSSTYHKDSYILHRRDRKLGGGIQQERYSRTMSPASHPDNNTSLDSSIMSPTGWDKHYNGRQNASTVVFNSDELKAIKSKQNFKELVASTPVLTSVPSPMETESPNHSSVSLDKVTVTRSTSEATTQVGPVSPRDKNNSLHSSHSSPSLKTYSVARSSSRSPTSQDNSRLQYGLASTPWHNSTEFLSTRYMYKSVWDQERAISQRNDSLSAAASTSRLNGLGKYDSSASIHRGSSLSSSPLTTSGSVSPLSSTPCSTPTTSLDTVSLAKQDSPSVQNVSTQTQNGEGPVASQEEVEDNHKQCNGTNEDYITLKYGREKKKEEIECEQLAKTLADQLPDTLQALLAPGPELKTTAHYIQDIFELKVDAGRRQVTENGEVNDNVVGSNNRCSDSAPLPANSEYFTTSEPKAKLLTTYSKDMSKSQEDLSANGNTATLLRKKEDLLRSISEKIKILREEQVSIREEMNMNEKLGVEILSVVEPVATASNINKLKLHISEIDKITSLLLGLSGRLARAVNALHNLPDNTNPEEKRILESKRDKLIEQLDEAKKLKNSIDQRSVSVSQMLQKYVTEEQYADYDHFIKMKAKLIMDSREIDDKIKLGEEQLKALQETLS